MSGRIDYQIEKYSFTAVDETPRLARQWAGVMDECRQTQAGAQERLRIALLNVDYVTSLELPFRLLLVRTPQLIDSLREELQISRKPAVISGSRWGCTYTLKGDLSAIPDAFSYRFSNRIRRLDAQNVTAAPYQQIAKEVKAPRERLTLALESGLQVTALDALFWFGIQRLAADVARLRKRGMRIRSAETEAFDSLTGTTRRVPFYQLAPR